MAKARKKPRSYFEPWIASKSRSHGDRPNVEGIPADAAESILGAWERSDTNADWILWGSGMSEPTISVGFPSGKTLVVDDRRIIAVRRTLGLPEGSPTNEEVCKRIADCVNALEGVADPEAFVSEVRSFLKDCATGDVDIAEDPRVVSLLSRCIPLKEIEKLCPFFE